MLSYRHAFHAGNHADVLKHTVLIAVLRYMTQKPVPLYVVDTHAGAGLYRLDGEYTAKSGEAEDGIFKFMRSAAEQALVPALQDYVEMIARFNPRERLQIYPGSPLIAQALLRQDVRDKLRLFEIHPTDFTALRGHVAQLQAGRQVQLDMQDGFEQLKAYLPPPARRGLVLIDPSYEIKSDYVKVERTVQDALTRFAEGVYCVWYPVIPRPEANELPRRLKTLANKAGKSYLHATLSIGRDEEDHVPGEPAARPGLTASGMFVINPPYTLRASMAEALPQMLKLLGRGRGQAYSLD